jgi:hypothetical protein
MTEPEHKQTAHAIIDILNQLADGTTPLHYGIRRIGSLVGRLTLQIDDLQARIDALGAMESEQERMNPEIDRRASFV